VLFCWRQQPEQGVEVVSGQVVEEGLQFRHDQVAGLVLAPDAVDEEIHVGEGVAARGAAEVGDAERAARMARQAHEVNSLDQRGLQAAERVPLHHRHAVVAQLALPPVHGHHLLQDPRRGPSSRAALRPHVTKPDRLTRRCKVATGVEFLKIDETDDLASAATSATDLERLGSPSFMTTSMIPPLRSGTIDV
jgi:hypothetical protein